MNNTYTCKKKKKVFEINALSYYLQHGKEIDTSINLDGLIAQEENMVTYSDVASPFSRIRRKFEFPSLSNKCGAFVIEFIGNGISSRALIRKGELYFVEQISRAGHVFFVRNEFHEPVCIFT